ncbi:MULTISPECIES: hypothetical protein [Flammeovirga]|uniref:STAS/SEC14 domain-containing protein n=1 Tax=Flammeovirga agarivorans TaxID=2726742 RepID=A0A7X8SNT0_9BACT|nr:MULTISPECIES: hypothetical protein [Flammeovirga]NLR93609.1 hypothetical protein [Flammeovirga agarivorans]
MSYEVIYTTDFHKVEWNKDEKVLKTTWFTPIDMEEEVYRQEVVRQIDINQLYAPEKMLVDTKEAYYNVLPATQDWINERFVKVLNIIPLEKMAWIVSEDFFAQVSFDQVMDDANDQAPFKIKHFTTEEEALEWLNE